MSEQTPTNLTNADFTFKDKNGNTGSNKGLSANDGTKLNNMVKLLNLLLNTPNSLDFANTLANINLSNLSASGTGIINSLIDTKLSDKANAIDLSNYLPLAGGNVTGNLTVQNKNVVRSVNGVNADADGNVVIASGYPSERYTELSMGNPIPVGDGRYFYSVTYTAPENGYFCIQADSVRNQDSELRIDNIDREWRNPVAYMGENATSSRKMSVYAPFAKGQRCRIYAICIEINSTHLVFCYGEN